MRQGKNRSSTISAFLGLGSNLGDRESYILKALQALEKEAGSVLSVSSLYETAPWGNADLKPFLNLVCKISTALEPLELLEKIEAIEHNMGRTSGKGNYSNRCIDIDILLYGDHIVETKKLTIPHPGLPRRKFVLVPLEEIASDVHHPKTELKISHMLRECPDKSKVKLLKSYKFDVS